MHIFYTWLGIYSVVELGMLNYTSDALLEASEEVFLPATLVLWCVWNMVDVLGVYLTQKQEETNGNEELASINRSSTRQLFLGTVFTASFIYSFFEMGILAGGFGAAPLSFSACMFFSAWDAQQRINELTPAFNHLVDDNFNMMMTLSDLYADNENKHAATADEIFEKLKELFIKYQIANPNEKVLDDALGKFTLQQIHDIFEQEIAYQKISRATWIACGTAMFAVALGLMQIAGLALFASPALPFVVGVIMLFVAISVAARFYLKHQEGAAQNKIISIAAAFDDTKMSLSAEDAVKVSAGQSPSVIPGDRSLRAAWETFKAGASDMGRLMIGTPSNDTVPVEQKSYIRSVH
jgi:hypothetical protein